MTRTRKIITATIAASVLGLSVASTATPAAAWCKFGCGGWGGGWGGPVAAGVVGGLALGAIAASASSASAAPVYYDSCIARQPVYDDYGNYRGTRRVRVAC